MQQDSLSSGAGSASNPTVSVVIATYNRTGPLKHAIQSVLNSSLTDWEIIVVGDACTDDTEECVAAFNNPRIRFFNLPVRWGYQSGPHNYGVSVAAGRYVAFLNHDDLFLPDHLSACVAELQSSGADLVWDACATVHPNPSASGNELPLSFMISGAPPNFRYSPFPFYFASSWVFRRSLADRVGPWVPADKEFVQPSQTWLFKAWRSGAKLRFLPKVGVIKISGSFRPNAYKRADCPEHDLLATWLQDGPAALARIFEQAAINEASRWMADHFNPPPISFLHVLLRPIYALCVAMNIHPRTLAHVIRHGRRGSLIRKTRKYTGSE